MTRHILHIDSSTKLCSLALSANGDLICQKEEKESNQHTRVINILIDEMLEEANLTVNDLSAISVAIGPGSYTGLRVGLSVAKGLAYALNIPIVPIGSLKALAIPFLGNSKKVISTIDARRDEVYLAIFNKEGATLADEHSLIIVQGEYPADWPEISDIILCGNGAGKTGELLKEYNLDVRPSEANAANQCQLAFEMLIEGNLPDIAYVRPNYLKPPNITKSRKKTVF